MLIAFDSHGGFIDTTTQHHPPPPELGARGRWRVVGPESIPRPLYMHNDSTAVSDPCRGASPAWVATRHALAQFDSHGRFIHKTIRQPPPPPELGALGRCSVVGPQSIPLHC